MRTYRVNVWNGKVLRTITVKATNPNEAISNAYAVLPAGEIVTDLTTI